VGGLAAGRDYKFRVSAFNSAGEGARSAAVAQSTAPSTPDGLTNTSATTTSITLQWSAVSVSTGADTVTGYKLYQRVVHDVSEVADVFSASGVSEQVFDHFLDPADNQMVVDTLVYDGKTNLAVTTTVAGLSGGRSYTFVLAAVSQAGDGNRSVPLKASTSPPAPTGLSSPSQTTTAIEMEWVAPPVADDAAAVTGYALYRNNGAGGAQIDTLVNCANADALSTNCSVTGLTGGRQYVFEVSALSAAGDSVRCAAPVSVSTSPAALSGISSTSQSTSTIDLRWSAPTVVGGSATTGYIVYRDDGLGGSDMSTVAYDGTGSVATSATITGLVGGRRYAFVIEAKSSAGTGDRSGVFHQSTSPAAPLALASISQTASTIAVQWNASIVAAGGAVVTTYTLYRNDGAQV
jgi:hypothetical protein